MFRRPLLIALSLLIAACSGSGGNAGSGSGGQSAGEPGGDAQKNASPIAVGDSAVQAGGALNLPVLLNDSDPDDDPLTIIEVGEPQHGSAQAAGSGVLYTPQGDFLGADEFTYTIDDGRGGRASTTVRIRAGLNAPRLTPDSAAVTPGSGVIIPVLANDLDLTGGQLRLTGVGLPADGSVIINNSATPTDASDDTLEYLAPSGFAGSVRFSYSAANDAGSAMSHVSVTVTDPDAAEPDSTVSGRAVKGALKGAAVSLYALDPRGLPRQPPLAQSITDESGFWSALVPSNHGPLLVVTDGGEYRDEADPDPDGGQVIRLRAGDTLTGVLPAGESIAAVTVFTDSLYRKSLFETQGDNFAAVFAGNRADATGAFSFDPVSTLPADPASPEAGMSEHSLRYALALGGAANIINEMAVYVGLGTPNHAVIDAFAEDFAECVLNGQGLSGPLQISVNGNAVNLPPRLSINTAIIRFRNNLAERYGTLLTQIDEATCSRPGFLADATAPVFSVAPGPLTVNAESAAGTPATSPAVAAILAAPQASDDRDGAITVGNDAPALLAPGLTPLTFFATDASGNRAELVVPVTVADLSPPALSIPADITVPQSGRVTAVALGIATAVDNVSLANAIVIDNDAPSLGFPPGTSTVTWTAVDQAGLATSAQQQVTVTSGGAPVLVTPLPDVVATEDSRVQLDLGAAFDVTGAPMPRYSVSGLAAGSGLLLDTNTGFLLGQPNDADVLAAPVTLVFAATNDGGTATDTFVLGINNVNDAPRFDTAAPTGASANLAYVYNVAGSDADPADRLVIRSALLPGWLSLVDNLNGTATLSGVPTASDTGSNRVVLELVDDAGATATQDFVISVSGNADLSLSLAVDNPTPAPGDIVTFTLTAANAGPSDAAGVVIGGLDGTGYHLLSASGAFDYKAFAWTVGPVAAGDSASLVVQAQVRSVGNYRMTAEVSAALLTDPDSTPANNVAAEDDYATAATSPIGGRPDSDSDGLPDADETGLYLTDPARADSDNDGVEDRIEVLVSGDGSLANSPATQVIFVNTNAAGSGDGSDWSQALRTTAEALAQLNEGTPGDPVYVLFATADQARYAPFTLSRNHVVIAGANPNGAPLVPGRGFASFDAQGANEPALIASGADQAFLFNLLLTGGQPSGQGGGLRVEGASDLFVHDSVIAGNDAGADGGGFAVLSGASLTLTDSRVFSNTARGMGGGGGFASGTLKVRNSVIADNIQWSAGGQPGGGGLTLRGNSASEVRDSMLLSNFSAADGGGFHANRINGDTLFHNNLVAGNANVNGFGGGIHADGIHFGPTLFILSSTIAWNQTVVDYPGFTLAGGIDLWSNADNVVVRDNIVWLNSDEDGSFESNDNLYERGSASVSYTNAAGYPGAGSNGNNDADPVFLEGYYLHQASSGALDVGSTSAAGAGLDGPYSTDINGTADSAALDQGFHYTQRSAGIADNVEVVAAYCRDRWVSENVSLVLRPRFGARELGPGHKVAVLQTGGPATTLLSVTALRPAGAGSALAADLGDGSYSVLLANAGLSGSVTLSVIVDDVGGGTISQELAAVDAGSCDVDSGRDRLLKRYPWLATPF